MGIVVIACVLVVLLGSSVGFVPKYNTSTWMSEMKYIIYNLSLLDVMLPGTHDSGAYEFSDVISPLEDPFLADLIKLCAELHVDIYPFIKQWAQTQDTTIYQQMMGGIRYVDLRANYIQNDWYTEHFLIGTKTQDLLNDIKQFISENRGEVVVVELGGIDPEDDELSLINMINNTLSPYLAPVMSLNRTTVGQMVERNQRIILLYEPSPYIKNHTFLWDKTVWMEGSYANKDKLSEMEHWNVQEINTKGGDGKIFELSWTLTAQDSGIITCLLDPTKRNETLKDLALEADGALDTFATQYSNFVLGNILLVDWWEYSNVVELAIGTNLRQCRDEPMWRATDPSGLYCRNFFNQGNCNSARYSGWMKDNCRLACGMC